MKGKSITFMLLLALFLTLENTMKMRYQQIPVIIDHMEILPDLAVAEKIFYDLDTIDQENQNELFSSIF